MGRTFIKFTAKMAVLAVLAIGLGFVLGGVGQASAAGGGGMPTSPVCDEAPTTASTLSLFTTQDGWLRGHTNRLATYNTWNARTQQQVLIVVGAKRSTKVTDLQWCRLTIKATYTGDDPMYGYPMYEETVSGASWVDKYSSSGDRVVTRTMPSYPWQKVELRQDFNYSMVVATYVSGEGPGGVWEDYYPYGQK